MALTKQYWKLTYGLMALLVLVCIAGLFSNALVDSVLAQDDEYERFREGEKLTYDISFEKFSDAAYAEVYVISKGTIEGKSAVELRGRIKSINLVSAAFYLFDRSRTVYASAETGLPLYIRDVSNAAGLPVESISNFISEPATNLDLLTMLFRARESGGAGSFSVLEKGRIYSFDFAAMGGERISTASGDFETTISSVTSSYFEENGISEVRVYFSVGPNRIPVKISVSTPKGSFHAVLASATTIAATPTPTVVKTVTPTPVPTVVPTPPPYKENQNLSAELPFKLGETLEYTLKHAGREVSRIVSKVESRKQVGGVDSLLIKAAVKDQGDGALFNADDFAQVWVDPYTLVPNLSSVRFAGALAGWSQEARFDQNRGTVSFGAGALAEVPIGTHSLLSFAYAIRSFNLRPSRDLKNPVNDTRVAVFVNSKAYILTLRPASNEKIDIAGQKVTAQPIAVITGDSSVDRLRPKVWLSADSNRVPLRISVGQYQADLVR